MAGTIAFLATLVLFVTPTFLYMLVPGPIVLAAAVVEFLRYATLSAAAAFLLELGAAHLSPLRLLPCAMAIIAAVAMGSPHIHGKIARPFWLTDAVVAHGFPSTMAHWLLGSAAAILAIVLLASGDRSRTPRWPNITALLVAALTVAATLLWVPRPPIQPQPKAPKPKPHLSPDGSPPPPESTQPPPSQTPPPRAENVAFVRLLDLPPPVASHGGLLFRCATDDSMPDLTAAPRPLADTLRISSSPNGADPTTIPITGPPREAAGLTRSAVFMFSPGGWLPPLLVEPAGVTARPVTDNRFRSAFSVLSSRPASTGQTMALRSILAAGRQTFGDPTWDAETGARLRASPDDARLGKLLEAILAGLDVTESAIPNFRVAAILEFLNRQPVFDSRGDAASQTLESFLFDGRGGSDVHFAAAAVVLLRTAGLPARMGLGFRRPTVDAQRPNMILTTRHQAAWPEIHVLGAGWVPLVITPQNVRHKEAPEPEPETEITLNEDIQQSSAKAWVAPAWKRPLALLLAAVLVATFGPGAWAYFRLCVARPLLRARGIDAPAVYLRSALCLTRTIWLSRAFGETWSDFSTRVSAADPRVGHLLAKVISAQLAAHARRPVTPGFRGAYWSLLFRLLMPCLIRLRAFARMTDTQKPKPQTP